MTTPMACPPRPRSRTARITESFLGIAAVATFAGALLGCDGEQGTQDAATPEGVLIEGVPTVQVAIRLDAPTGVNASASVLAFKAEVSGIDPEQVLAAVDPLMAAPPAAGCVLQAVDGVSNRLRGREGWVELEALGDVQVDLGPANGTLRPSPSVYPDLATVVAGVVGEAGPVDLAELPTELHVRFGKTGVLALSVPHLGEALINQGLGLKPGQNISVRSDLDVQVSGDAGSFIEIRPFGAMLWGACALTPVPGTGTARVIVPASILQKLARLSGEVPVSFDVVWRSVSSLAEATPTPTPGLAARVSLETRTSALVKLIP